MTQNRTDNRLTPAQKRAIAALLSSRSVSEAADVAKIARSTLNRWLQDDTFRLALAEAEDGIIDGATRRLTSLIDKSIAALEGMLDNPQTPVFAKLRAAEAVIEHAIRLRELRSIEQRLSKLEGMLLDGGQEGTGFED
jgi:hypothetical protein